MTDEKKDNTEYFPGKPGFYKKGSGEFKLNLGSLDDLVDEAEEPNAKEEEVKRPKIVPPPEDTA